MPQMAPLWWELFFILFNLLFFMNMIIIYFNYKPCMISKKMHKMSHNMTWKW